MTLHPIPLNFLIYIRKICISFYQCDAGNPTFIASSVLTLSLLPPLYASHCGLLRTCNFRGQRPPRMQMRRPPSHTLTGIKTETQWGNEVWEIESSVQHCYKYNDCVLYDMD
jgi:hypothetical protein